MHVKITINVTFDQSTTPANIVDDLERNVLSCIEGGMLMDVNGEAVVDEFTVDITQPE